jgi:hypothetical protein
VHELRELRLAVERLHGCKARRLEAVAIEETFQGNTVWEGIVEVFELNAHPKAKRCYAWKHAEDDGGKQSRIVTVLGVPPVDSPLAAVRVAIVEQLEVSATDFT